MIVALRRSNLQFSTVLAQLASHVLDNARLGAETREVPAELAL
jgi:hypothetical protein